MSHILNIAFVFLHTVAFSWVCVVSASAQLSGAVDLGGGTSEASSGSSEQNTKFAKQILVTGIGATPESAEKQAITDAVRQAVGAYVDTNTIVENEAVIKDRILSVSNGFVKEYKVVSPAKQRDDGLYELQILATVQTGQLVQALKESNLISGEVAGANMWAEASTKVMNAQDAVAMLQAKMPELIKSSVTITPLGEDGKPMLSKDGTPNTAPASVKEDAATGKATLIWYLEMGLDKKYYKETLLPLVQKCMDAITGVSPKEIVAHTDVGPSNAFAGLPKAIKFLHTDIYHRHNHDGVYLFKFFSLSFDCYEALHYDDIRSELRLSAAPFDDSMSFSAPISVVNVKLKTHSGEVLAMKKIRGWQPFVFDRNALIAVGPNLRFGGTFLEQLSPLIVVPLIELDLALLKDTKTVEISLEVPDFTLSLGSN